MQIKNFLIVIGTAKAGTTTLTSWLGEREDFVVAESKEPKFLSDIGKVNWTGPQAAEFTRIVPKDETAYFRQFQGKPDATWAVDASTDYLWCEESLGRIDELARHYPARIICIVRDPVDRAVSQFRHTQRFATPETLGQALDAEAQRVAKSWQPLFWHVRRSQVFADISRFKTRFGDDMIVVDFAELNDPDTLMRKICAFLNVPERPVVQSGIVHNQTILPKNAAVKYIWKNPALRAIAKAVIPKSVRHQAYALTHSSRNVVVKPAEIVRLKSLLRTEIAACLASPLIPTDNWKTSVDTAAEKLH